MKVWRNLLWVGLTLLTACATTETIKGPDGTPHELVSCSDVTLCYSKASEVCGGKYKIVNTSSDVSGGKDGTETTVQLLVKCEGKAPAH